MRSRIQRETEGETDKEREIESERCYAHNNSNFMLNKKEI